MYAAAKATIGRGDNVVATDGLGETDNPVRDYLGMLDQVSRVADNAR